MVEVEGVAVAGVDTKEDTIVTGAGMIDPCIPSR